MLLDELRKIVEAAGCAESEEDLADTRYARRERSGERRERERAHAGR